MTANITQTDQRRVSTSPLKVDYSNQKTYQKPGNPKRTLPSKNDAADAIQRTQITGVAVGVVTTELIHATKILDTIREDIMTIVDTIDTTIMIDMTIMIPIILIHITTGIDLEGQAITAGMITIDTSQVGIAMAVGIVTTIEIMIEELVMIILDMTIEDMTDTDLPTKLTEEHPDGIVAGGGIM